MKPKAYIVDIDGTLADAAHRLHFINGETKDWDAFFNASREDALIEDVARVVRALSKETIIQFVTGRPEKNRHATDVWLFKNAINLGQNFMRPDGDRRPDTVVKREIYEKQIQPYFEIVGVFEDRPSVCRMWRDLGLTVFQMTHEEF